MSVSKPFIFALVCEALGVEEVREKVGVNATGLAFNSLARTYAPIWNVLTGVLAAEFRDLDTLASLAGAVRAGDPEKARAAGRSHVEIGRRAVEKALDAVGIA